MASAFLVHYTQRCDDINSDLYNFCCATPGLQRFAYKEICWFIAMNTIDRLKNIIASHRDGILSSHNSFNPDEADYSLSGVDVEHQTQVEMYEYGKKEEKDGIKVVPSLPDPLPDVLYYIWHKEHDEDGYTPSYSRTGYRYWLISADKEDVEKSARKLMEEFNPKNIDDYRDDEDDEKEPEAVYWSPGKGVVPSPVKTFDELWDEWYEEWYENGGYMEMTCWHGEFRVIKSEDDFWEQFNVIKEHAQKYILSTDRCY